MKSRRFWIFFLLEMICFSFSYHINAEEIISDGNLFIQYTDDELSQFYETFQKEEIGDGDDYLPQDSEITISSCAVTYITDVIDYIFLALYNDNIIYS